MGLDDALGFAARAAVLFAVALAAASLLRRAPAFVRRHVLALALGASLALPALSIAFASLLPGRAMPRLVVLPVSVEPFAEGPVSIAAPAPGGDARPSVAALREAPRATAPASWRHALAVAWLAGALVILGRIAGSSLRVGRVVRRSDRLPRDGAWGGWARTIAAAAGALGVRVDARITDDVGAPAVTGVFSPVVLLPRAAVDWTFARRRVVALHELAHVKHRDPLAQIVGQLACAAYWFVPLAWWTARRLRAESELAADERVVAAGVRATTYAEHLLAIAVHAGAAAAWGPGGAVEMAARPSELSRRIESLVARDGAARRITRGKNAALRIAALATTLVVACAGAEPRAASRSLAVAPEDATRIDDTSHATRTGDARSHDGRAVSSTASRSDDTRGASPTAVRGASTIDPRLQRIAEDEIATLRAEWRPDDAFVVILDPRSGAILAMTSDTAARRAFVPGSTMKPFVVAAALDADAIRADQRFSCDDGRRPYASRTMRDASAHGVLDVAGILAVSSNIGASRIYDELGFARLADALARFHFGEVPAGLEGAASGAIPTAIGDAFDGARIAIGVGETATPVQIAAAFAALVNGGVYHAPTLVMPRARAAAGEERVLREATSRTVTSLLVAAIDHPESTGKAARVAGVAVAGKTGTSDRPSSETPASFASFVGAAPADSPELVVFVGADGPPELVVFVGADGPAKRGEPGSGGDVAAPAFARIAARGLRELASR